MALEKSCLTDSDIHSAMRANYGLTVEALEKMPLGSANCFRVTAGGKRFFLKEFQSGYARESIEREAHITQFLSENGIPAARIYPTIPGGCVFEHSGHIVCLEEYIDGTAYGYDDLPEHLLNKVAAMLGKIHAAMMPLDLPRDMGADWLATFSADILAAQYRKLESAAAQYASDPNSSRIIEDMRYKAALSERCDGYIKYHDGITYSPTHGDYQACQLIWKGDDIAAVIDFSSAATLPVVWEIMRSFVQSSKSCRHTAHIDVESLQEYVREYLKSAPLTRADLESMPYVYLFQLARSKYGYGQYLNSTSEDRNSLLDFAFWRTAMCREVESRAAEISQALTTLI